MSKTIPTLTQRSLERIHADIHCPLRGWKGGWENLVESISRVRVIGKRTVIRYRLHLKGGTTINTMKEWRQYNSGDLHSLMVKKLQGGDQ